MANLNLSEFTEKLFVADADHTFIWDTAASISKRVSRNSWLSGTTANCRLGLADAASPVAQTLSVQSVVAGTTNTAGAAFTIDGSQGTGTGAGGPLIFRTAPAGSSGTAQNALGTALTLTAPGYVVPKSWLLQNGFSSGLEMYGSDADALSRNVGNSRRAIFNGVYLVGNSGFSIGWSLNNGVGNDGANFGQADTILVRDGVGTLALRNGAAAQTFNVYGTSSASNANYARLALTCGLDGNATISTQALGTGTAGVLAFSPGNSERMRITSAGNVGIGTTAPAVRLDVAYSGSGKGISLRNTSNPATLDGEAGIDLGFSSSRRLVIGSSANSNFNSVYANFNYLESIGQPLTFVQNSVNVLTLNSGNVGIGTTSPTSKLQVSAGDVEVDTIAKGVILKSPDGTRYRVTVANGGTLSVAAV